MTPPSVTLYLAFVAAVALERMFELALSRRNVARALSRGAIEVGAGHFRAMTVLHSTFLVACVAEVLALHRAVPGALAGVALAGVALAQALRYWAVTTLGDRWTVRVIVEPGRAPVTAGPYRWVRHPNYVAVALEIACLPLVHGAWLTAVVYTALNGAMLAVRIRAEEAALRAYTPYDAHLGGRPRFVPSAPRGVPP